MSYPYWFKSLVLFSTLHSNETTTTAKKWYKRHFSNNICKPFNNWNNWINIICTLSIWVFRTYISIGKFKFRRQYNHFDRKAKTAIVSAHCTCGIGKILKETCDRIQSISWHQCSSAKPLGTTDVKHIFFFVPLRWNFFLYGNYL